jgi:hypothetical protein
VLRISYLRFTFVLRFTFTFVDALRFTFVDDADSLETRCSFFGVAAFDLRRCPRHGNLFK